ncbi:hypothetical protein LINPERPRIM_LOCUS43089 [Linum perenne]
MEVREEGSDRRLVTEGAATTEKDAKVPDEDNGTVRAETNPEEVFTESFPLSVFIKSSSLIAGFPEKISCLIDGIRGAVAPVKASGLVLNRDTAGKQAIRVVERQADDG